MSSSRACGRASGKPCLHTCIHTYSFHTHTSTHIHSHSHIPIFTFTHYASILTYLYKKKNLYLYIYAYTYTYTHRGIGFVSDERRLNVAITRSKACLCIVGNSRLLKGDSNQKNSQHTWSALWQNFYGMHAVVEVSDRSSVNM